MLDEIHQKTGTGFDQGNAIRWNFGKFLGAAFVFFMKKDMSPRLQKSLLGFASSVDNNRKVYHHNNRMVHL